MLKSTLMSQYQRMTTQNPALQAQQQASLAAALASPLQQPHLHDQVQQASLSLPAQPRLAWACSLHQGLVGAMHQQQQQQVVQACSPPRAQLQA